VIISLPLLSFYFFRIHGENFTPPLSFVILLLSLSFLFSLCLFDPKKIWGGVSETLFLCTDAEVTPPPKEKKIHLAVDF
jgi:hypothetical protein